MYSITRIYQQVINARKLQIRQSYSSCVKIEHVKNFVEAVDY